MGGVFGEEILGIFGGFLGVGGTNLGGFWREKDAGLGRGEMSHFAGAICGFATWLPGTRRKSWGARLGRDAPDFGQEKILCPWALGGFLGLAGMGFRKIGRGEG